jgi:ribosome-binding factor A
MVTVTGVELTPDYAHARVFYTALADAAARQGIEAGLRAASGFLRRELGRRIRLHTLPQLHFVFDESVERGDRLSRLIDEAVKSDRHQ